MLRYSRQKCPKKAHQSIEKRVEFFSDNVEPGLRDISADFELAAFFNQVEQKKTICLHYQGNRFMRKLSSEKVPLKSAAFHPSISAACGGGR